MLDFCYSLKASMSKLPFWELTIPWKKKQQNCRLFSLFQRWDMLGSCRVHQVHHGRLRTPKIVHQQIPTNINSTRLRCIKLSSTVWSYHPLIKLSSTFPNAANVTDIFAESFFARRRAGMPPSAWLDSDEESEATIEEIPSAKWCNPAEK